MPELSETTYSRQATIDAVTDYYEFLTKLYLKDSQVIYPPASGWPSITDCDPDTLKSLGKSSEVLMLLAHLPYIRSPGNWNDDAHGAPGCCFADWQALITGLARPVRSTFAETVRTLTEGVAFRDLAPPHVVGLTFGSRDNPVMVLDTKLGIIHWEECPSEIQMEYFATTVDYEPPSDEEHDNDDEDEENDQDAEDEEGGEDDEDDEDDQDNHRDSEGREEETEWRQSAPAWAIPDFFEVLKDQFRKLHWIPVSQHTVRSVSWGEARCEGIIAMLKETYHQHGWPDLTRYRKSDCLEAVRRVLQERFPSEVDPRGD